MRLSRFAAGRDAFSAAVKRGQIVEVSPVTVSPLGNGLPVWPALAFKSVVERAPSPDELAAAVERTIGVLLPAVRAGGAFLGTAGVIAGAFSPLAGALGKIAAPGLAAAAGAVGSLATPAVGAAAAAAVGAAAAAAGPIVGVGGAAAAAVGGAASGAPDPAALRDLGRQVEEQLGKLDATQAADVVVDVVPS